MSSTPKTDITLYTAGTPNGQKISITLEELGLKYETVHIDISKNVQKEDWYLKINPNGRIPAIIDKTPVPVEITDGMKQTEKRVFEGEAILLWLTQKYDKDYKLSYPHDTDRYWEVVQWLSWMHAGLGPMQGQANHFYRYAPEKFDYAIKRYQAETKRLYQVLEERLVERHEQNKTAAGTLASQAGPYHEPEDKGPWIVGDKITIADIACFAWINWAEWAGIDVSEFPEISAWLERINGRPKVQTGLNVPEPFKMKEKMKTKEGEEEYAKYHSEWVMKGQQKDQEK